MALVVKEIKPGRFKTSAFRAAIAQEMILVGNEMVKDFEKTTATWKHKPKFEKVDQLSPPTVMVSTDDEIYGYVDKGTRAHLIFAGIYTGKSDKKALAFKPNFSPKTRPGVIGSFRGGSSGKKVARPYVEHPGSKPRGFEKEITKKWQKLFKRRMERAMSRAAKASGHGL